VTGNLEEQLADLGRHLQFPPTPPLAALVRPRLHTAATRPLRRRLRLILATAAAVVAIVLGVPPIRTAVAHWLGIQGVVISPRTSLIPTPAVPPPPSGSSLGANLGLGQRSTLDGARRTAGFTVVAPQALGPPDAVYVRSDLGPVVTLVYAPRSGLPPSHQTGVGLLVTEFRGATDPMLIQKFIGPDTRVTPVSVDGGAGLWLDGAPHQLAYMLPDGSFVADTLRLAGPTLAFERGDLTVRIEGAIGETRALAVAHSLQ
jgi:hypothetical protein